MSKYSQEQVDSLLHNHAITMRSMEERARREAQPVTDPIRLTAAERERLVERTVAIVAAQPRTLVEQTLPPEMTVCPTPMAMPPIGEHIEAVFEALVKISGRTV